MIDLLLLLASSYLQKPTQPTPSLMDRVVALENFANPLPELYPVRLSPDKTFAVFAPESKSGPKGQLAYIRYADGRQRVLQPMTHWLNSTGCDGWVQVSGKMAVAIWLGRENENSKWALYVAKPANAKPVVRGGEDDCPRDNLISQNGKFWLTETLTSPASSDLIHSFAMHYSDGRPSRSIKVPDNSKLHSNDLSNGAVTNDGLLFIAGGPVDGNGTWLDGSIFQYSLQGPEAKYLGWKRTPLPLGILRQFAVAPDGEAVAWLIEKRFGDAEYRGVALTETRTMRTRVLGWLQTEYSQDSSRPKEPPTASPDRIEWTLDSKHIAVWTQKHLLFVDTGTTTDKPPQRADQYELKSHR
jgi:hypothetical protein